MSDVNGWCECAFRVSREALIPGSQAHHVPFYTTLWLCSSNPYSGVLRGLISQLSGDYFALLQLND